MAADALLSFFERSRTLFERSRTLFKRPRTLIGPSNDSSQISTWMRSGVRAAIVANPNGITPIWNGDHLAAADFRKTGGSPVGSLLKAGFTRSIRLMAPLPRKNATLRVLALRKQKAGK